jgi:hypothetical protein
MLRTWGVMVRFGAVVSAALIIGAAVAARPADARSFRQFNAIATPQGLPDGAELLPERRPIDRALVERAVRAIVRAWNTGGLDPILAPDFQNRQRLLDTLLRTAPRDAELQVVAVRGVSTLRQYRVEEPAGPVRVSTVAAVVRTQVVFNDPVTGYQRLPGTNEFVLEFREPVS